MVDKRITKTGQARQVADFIGEARAYYMTPDKLFEFLKARGFRWSTVTRRWVPYSKEAQADTEGLVIRGTGGINQ